MARYDYRCDGCGRSTELQRSINEGPPPSFVCRCGGMRHREWTTPGIIVRGEGKRDRLKLPGINLAAYQRSNDKQEEIYRKVISHKRYRDGREKRAQGTSTGKLNGKLFRRVGSMPRELLVAESRSQQVAPGTLLKTGGTNLYKKHGCWWGEK